MDLPDELKSLDNSSVDNFRLSSTVNPGTGLYSFYSDYSRIFWLFCILLVILEYSSGYAGIF